MIDNPELEIKITIEGDSEMPFRNHDLKVKAILALLDTIDIKQCYEDDLQEEGYKAAADIISSTKAAFGLDLFE